MFIDHWALDIVKKSGYSDAKIIDKSTWFASYRGCSNIEHDDAKFTILANNNVGKPSKVNVCCGKELFSGCVMQGN